jgi:hypothetical protein
MDKATEKQRSETIAKQYAGIFSPYEAFYIHSILYSARRCLASFDDFEIAVSKGACADEIFGHVQEALSHAASVSRFFWPTKAENQLAVARGQKLRDEFQLVDASPLKWRRLRNAFEHFDEALDRFLLRDPSGVFFPGAIVGNHELADEAVGNIFKLLDPSCNVCVILGEKFEYRPIIEAVRKVLTDAQRMDAQGARLKRG